MGARFCQDCTLESLASSSSSSTCLLLLLRHTNIHKRARAHVRSSLSCVCYVQASKLKRVEIKQLVAAVATLACVEHIVTLAIFSNNLRQRPVVVDAMCVCVRVCTGKLACSHSLTCVQLNLCCTMTATARSVRASRLVLVRARELLLCLNAMRARARLVIIGPSRGRRRRRHALAH